MTASTRSTRSNLIFFGLLAAVITIYLFVLRPRNYSDQGENHRAVGATMPDISLTPLVESEATITRADLNGKVVLINFWATWCGPCQMEFPHIVAIEQKFRQNPNFQLLSIASPGGGETEQDMREATAAYLAQRKVQMPVFLDPYGTTFQAMQRATGAGQGIPLTFVVDQQGIVRGIWEGYRPGVEAQMEAAVQKLLPQVGTQVATSR